MASITYDGQSFMLDGRRIWLVSGSIHFGRVPHQQWEDRIHAARLAGLNTIETPVFWNLHEPMPGKFDFEGDRDIRKFVQLVHEAGMYCILRPGPFVGHGWDMGGLPTWLLGIKDIKLRTANQPYLEACSRYITALCEQVKDLQLTSPGEGGSIVLVQNENNWTCGHETLALGYLRELGRYYREAGITVPLINANNLWQGIEGEIDGWVGSGNLLSTIRQLSAVRPNQPKIIIQYPTGKSRIWGQPEIEPSSPMAIQRNLGEVLAAGGQFNLDPFHAAPTPGFWGGKTDRAWDSFLATDQINSHILGPGGEILSAYKPIKRICSFASQFGKLLSNLDPTYQPVVLDSKISDGSGGKKRPKNSCSITTCHVQGSQGGMAVVFRDLPEKGDPSLSNTPMNLLLGDGTGLEVSFGDQAVIWCIFDHHLVNRSHLDYCSLCALAMVGKVFVCYGPAGSSGEICINGSPLEVIVPRGKNPLIEEHEGVTIVVCSQAQADVTFVLDQAVYVGAETIDAQGRCIAAPNYRTITRIDAQGQTKSITPHQPEAESKASLKNWLMASTEKYTDGSSPRFASIPEPGDMVSLGASQGYGWYRASIKKPSTKKARILAPSSGDRLHLFLDGQHKAVMGLGVGTEQFTNLSLKKGDHEIVYLAEILGRATGGNDLDSLHGLKGHLWEVTPMQVGKPEILIERPVDVLEHFAPLWETRLGDVTVPEHITWTITHRRKSPIILTIDDFEGRALLILNGTPIRVLERGGFFSLLLDSETLNRGKNVFQIAMFSEALGPEDDAALAEKTAAALAVNLTFNEGITNLTEKAEWSFAKWEAPPRMAFKAMAKSGMANISGPTWWRCSLNADPAGGPIYFDAHGLTKGQIYLNGHNVCRYFVATANGKAVGPQSTYLLPSALFKDDGNNELLIFDEHGGNPGKSKLVQSSSGPWVQASFGEE